MSIEDLEHRDDLGMLDDVGRCVSCGGDISEYTEGDLCAWCDPDVDTEA